MAGTSVNGLWVRDWLCSTGETLPTGLPQRSEQGQAASKAAIDATSTDYGLSTHVLPHCGWSKSECLVGQTCRTEMVDHRYLFSSYWAYRTNDERSLPYNRTSSVSYLRPPCGETCHTDQCSSTPQKFYRRTT